MALLISAAHILLKKLQTAELEHDKDKYSDYENQAPAACRCFYFSFHADIFSVHHQNIIKTTFYKATN